jgi:hypothetical protein
LHVTGYGRPSGWRRPCGGLALGQILALLLLVPRAAAAAISAGPTIDVPWMQSVNDFADVTAAVLTDGSFAIASTETFQPTPQQLTTRLQAQFFRATGAPQTRPVVLRPLGGVGSAGVGSVGSRYFLAWEGHGGAHAAFYSQQGILLAAAIDRGILEEGQRLRRQLDRRTQQIALAEGAMAGALLELNGAGKGVVVWQTEELDADGSVAAKAGHLRVIQVNR